LRRIVRRVPIVTKFLAFFAPPELTPRPPANVPEAIQPAPLTPAYNHRARRPRGLTL
jgi:hypothetical protein